MYGPMSDYAHDAPLAGRRVILTRAAGKQADASNLALRQLGALPIAVPTIAIAPVDDLGPLAAALAQQPDLLVVTSANAVGPLATALSTATGPRPRIICAVGPSTAAALAVAGVAPTLIAREHRAEGVIAALSGLGLEGTRALLPTTRGARELLPEALRALGVAVDVVWVYQTVVAPQQLWAAGLAEWRGGGADALIFSSGSTVRNLASILGKELQALTAGLAICAIGPQTADACTKEGLRVDVCPAHYTMDDLLRALVAYFAAGSVAH